MKKKLFLTTLEWSEEIECLVFAETASEFEKILKKQNIKPEDWGIELEPQAFVIGQIKEFDKIPQEFLNKNGTIDKSFLFGLDKGENIMDYFKEEQEKLIEKRIDEQNFHFPFWDEVKTKDI